MTGHELYNAGHLIQAGVAHLRATGAVSLTDICERYAECIRREFVDNGNTGLPAHPGIETALVELYRATGNRQHLDLAMLFIDRRGEGRLGTGRFGSYYYQDHLPIRDAEAVTGHAVMALYLGAGLVDAYVETGDAELLAAAQRQWQDMVATKTYITGGVGSRYRDESIGDPYELPPDLAYCETCASVASVMLSWRLLMVTGEGKYADLIERTLYNGVLPGVSLDGTRFFYANPLHVRATHMDSFDKIGATERQPWFYCACCPPNVMRIFSSLEHIIASESDNCVQVHQYVACTIASAFAGVTLDVRTELPWSGRSEVTITRTPAMVWALSLRIPAWAAKGALGTLNGEQVDVEPDASGYLRIARAWTRGDVVALSFPVEARWVVPVHRLDAVRGCVAIERGPLVYCFEHADQPSEVDIDDTAVATGEIAEHPWRDDLGGIVALKVTGFRLPKPAGEWPYADLANPAVERPRGEIGLTAIPYYVWAHRGRGGMRIWIPAAERGSE